MKTGGIQNICSNHSNGPREEGRHQGTEHRQILGRHPTLKMLKIDLLPHDLKNFKI